MGMYTGIRFKGYVKPEFREEFENIALRGKWKESNIKEFREFGERFDRASFIPCGGLAYMPESWEIHNDKYEKYSFEWFNNTKSADGFERTYNKETGYWTFQCSLKNYESEIENWFELLPLFVEKIDHLEYFYEEDEYSSKYDLVDGEIVCVDNKFIKYND